MPKILVTGGAGYLGSQLVPQLLYQQHEVTVLDLFPQGGISLAGCFEILHNFKAVKGDVRDYALVNKLVSQNDIIIPLAAVVGAPACAASPYEATHINTNAVQNIVWSASKDQRIIFPATDLQDPHSHYGLTKQEAEKAVLDSGKGVALKLASLFGVSPKMRWDLIVNSFTYLAFKGQTLGVYEGEFKRNFVHVSDAARAFMMIANRPKTNSVYNVGNRYESMSKLELCKKIQSHIGSFKYNYTGEHKDPDRRDFVSDFSALEGLGWVPYWNLDEGIKELVNFKKVDQP